MSLFGDYIPTDFMEKEKKEAPATWVGTVNSITGLNLRSTASKTEDNVKRVLKDGDRVEVLGELNGFYNVAVGNDIGFVDLRYIQ